MADLRIGLGYDVHAFADGRDLVLGGVTLDHERGLAGHSDADVLVHALMDAILGAMREGDIGKLFPDTDPAFRGADSLVLLGRVMELARERGYALVDADCVVALEEPKVSPDRDRMRAAIASAAGVDIGRIGLKATTTEGLGFTGRREGVASWAVVLMERSA